MNPLPVVAVGFEEAGVRRAWVSQLASRMDGVRVVGVDEVDPSSVDVLVVGNPDGSDLGRFESIRFVQSAWAGVDRLTEGAPAVPIARMVAPGLTELMAEFVMAAVWFLHRGLPGYRREQATHRWRPSPVVSARERPVGVLGVGALGAPTAEALVGAGFDVKAWARSPRSGAVEVLAGDDGLERVLRRSEILVNLLPLTEETRGILNQRTFGEMPRGAALVNVGRGGHVVESDLLQALDSGHLSDAVLDVFEQEPLPPDHPFWSHERVTVLPHIAAPSRPGELAPLVAANIQRFLAGETPHFLVGRA